MLGIILEPWSNCKSPSAPTVVEVSPMAKFLKQFLKENVAIWTSKNGFWTFYSNRVLMSTGVNFMFLHMKIEI